jgi:small subunit ribosomal protein S20
MPHTHSAEKRHRQDEKRRLHNRAIKKAIKTQIKAFFATLTDGTAEAKAKEFTAAVKKLDRAAAKRVIHPNAAARKKSQLARKLHSKAPGAPAASAKA